MFHGSQSVRCTPSPFHQSFSWFWSLTSSSPSASMQLCLCSQGSLDVPPTDQAWWFHFTKVLRSLTQLCCTLRYLSSQSLSLSKSTRGHPRALRILEQTSGYLEMSTVPQGMSSLPNKPTMPENPSSFIVMVSTPPPSSVTRRNLFIWSSLWQCFSLFIKRESKELFDLRSFWL